MRRFLKSAILSTSLILAAPTLAHAFGFESSINAPITSPVKLEVSLSEDLAYRASNLPEKLSDRGSGSAFGTAFSQNGHYGERDLERLQGRVEERLLEQFAKRGITVSDTAPTIFRVTLTDVKNNRPTFEQLSQDPSLSFHSFGTGGAELDAELLSASGQPLGTMNYDWYDTDFRDGQFGGVWNDAYRAIDRFAMRAAKELVRGAES